MLILNIYIQIKFHKLIGFNTVYGYTLIVCWYRAVSTSAVPTQLVATAVIRGTVVGDFCDSLAVGAFMTVSSIGTL